MPRDDLRLIRLPKTTWEDLVQQIDAPPFYRHVVGSTRFTSTWRVALVLVEDQIAGATVVRKFGTPGRGQDGLEFRTAERLMPLAWHAAVDAVPESLRRHLERKQGEPLSPKAGQALERALRTHSTEAGPILDRLRALATPSQHSGSQVVVREQRDAVALALELGGMDSRELLGDGDEAAISGDVPFLTGLTRIKASEAANIRYDATVFDGWLEAEADHFDVHTFRDPSQPGRQVTIFYADKEDLERQTGTDLLYYRHHRPGFILVQYKRLRRPDRGDGAPTYFPDDQLTTELARYRALPRPGPPKTVDDWRLTEDAFLVKLVRDDLAKPPANTLTWGMYLPISLVELLLTDAATGRRPKGWSAEALDTYLSNTEFLQLAKQGYIGTRGATTEHLTALIRGSFEAQRGIIVAVDQTDPTATVRLHHG
ncbi:MAG: hypothetical protein QM572_10015 [Nocardioides sp.]|uniref:hypothetical protein n=1 Tax=Nocardioides sp. TaxID=35761 RepID=UPI0039E456DA